MRCKIVRLWNSWRDLDSESVADLGDAVRNIYMDSRIESYEGYVPDDWAPKAFGPVKPDSALDHLLVDLLLAWRTTAYTASMPATAIKVAQATTLGYANFVSPDSSIIQF